MLRPARKFYDWAGRNSLSPNAHWWLGFVFLSEAVLFLPLDGVLILFCMHNPQKRFIYALTATLASALVGTIGYWVGYLLWDAIGPHIVGTLISADFFGRLVAQYSAYENFAVFLGSLLPFPFKAITLSAGFCHLGFVVFLASVVAARAVRFFFIAQVMHLAGPWVKAFIDRHFNRILMAIGAKIALTVAFFWILGA